MRNQRAIYRANLPVIILILSLLTACQTELYRGLQEQEANEMIAVLSNEDISITKEINKEGFVTLLLDSSSFSKAINILRENGMPRTKYLTIGDVYKKEGLISSPSEERARFLFARSQELSSTLSDLNDVLKARVHIAIPEQKSLIKKTPKPSASVWIWHNSDAVTDSLIPQIKTAVAYSVEELEYSNVMVFLIPSNKNIPAKNKTEYTILDEKNGNLLSNPISFWFIIIGLFIFSGMLIVLSLRVRKVGVE